MSLFTAPVQGQITNAPPPTAIIPYKIAIVASGLEHPWALQFLPDGRPIVTERSGRIRVVNANGRLSQPISGVPRVVAREQGGLLDLALAHDFAQSRTVFLSYSEQRDAGRNGTSVATAKLDLTADGGVLSEVKVIFRQEPAVASPLHFGCRIVETADGSLFITLGERYFQKDQAQNPANHLGKIVRINPDGTPSAKNPLLPGWAPEVWSIGHRNLQGAALDPVTGDLWTTEHGAMGGDELNQPRAGLNYGWPIITYGRDYNGAKIGIGTQREGLEQPVYYWDPSIATSGLAFYTGTAAAWHHNLFAGGLAGMHIARLVMNDGKVVGEEQLLADRGWRVRDVRMGPDGRIWALTDEDDGKVVAIEPQH